MAVAIALRGDRGLKLIYTQKAFKQFKVAIALRGDRGLKLRTRDRLLN